MRGLARIGYTLAGMALLAPAAAQAGLPVPAGAPWSPAQTTSKPSVLKKKASANADGRTRLCAECERKRVMAKEGVAIPPPPPLPPGTIARNDTCSVCGQPAAVFANRLPSRTMPGAAAPGYASTAGGPVGYASTGTDPMPIGTFETRLAAAAPAGAPGPRDASVMPTSVASDPLNTGKSQRPHILTHLFGLDAIGHMRSDERNRKKAEEHAMIPYGLSSANPVQDVPATAVYGTK